MKRIAIALMLLAAPALATEKPPSLKLEPLDDFAESAEKAAILQSKITIAVSKFIYVSRDCGKPIDPEKFKTMAKLKAFSEGYQTIEGVDWKSVKRQAHIQYGALKMEAPEGELCEKYVAFLKGKYHWLKDSDQ